MTVLKYEAETARTDHSASNEWYQWGPDGSLSGSYQLAIGGNPAGWADFAIAAIPAGFKGVVSLVGSSLGAVVQSPANDLPAGTTSFRLTGAGGGLDYFNVTLVAAGPPASGGTVAAVGGTVTVAH